MDAVQKGEEDGPTKPQNTGVKEVHVRDGMTVRLACSTTDGLRTRSGPGGDTSGDVVWDAAHVLNSILLAHPVLVAGKRVLEIGAGKGLCGLVAHHLGADEVVLTDSIPELVHSLQATAALATPPGRVHGRKLDWEVEVEAEGPLPPSDRYEVVLSSDIVYAEKHAELVAAVVARRLAEHTAARSIMVMGIRGVMWQMMDHGSPVYLLEKLIAEFRKNGLGVAAVPLVMSPSGDGATPEGLIAFANIVGDSLGLDSSGKNSVPTETPRDEEFPPVEGTYVAIVNWHIDASQQ